MTVYVDDCFVYGNDWGKWQGGGHMQADTLDELHAMAEQIGLRRSWFQSRRGRPENDHYDLTRQKREQAFNLGAVSETVESGSLRRRALRDAK